MRYYIGLDWADQEHAIWVEDEAGRKVLGQRLPHTASAWSEWGRWLHERRADGIELWAAIERPDGRMVDFVLDRGVVVYPINPKALDRARDRFRPSGSKSDPFDAQVLAGFLRTDHGHLRPLAPNSEAAQELKGLTRDYQRQVRLRTRLLNQLTVTLKEYYPRALEIGEDLTSPWTWAFLRAYPTPAAAAELTARRWAGWARPHRLRASRIADVAARLAQPQLPVPAHVVRVLTRRVDVLVGELAVAHAAVEAYRQAIDDFFASMPAAKWARSLPAGQSGVTVPTLWAELGDAPGRWQSFRHLQAHGGAVPVTERSGKQHWVHFRFACNLHLRHAVHQFAFQSLRHSDWARAYYDAYRKRGHDHAAALRALGAKWLKIIFVMWRRQVPYDEMHHLATIARQRLRQAA
ncbi:MAG: IS110 family transposase [Candidatus Rokuibacteriota bacterium]